MAKKYFAKNKHNIQTVASFGGGGQDGAFAAP